MSDDDLIKRGDALNACYEGWNWDEQTIEHIHENISKIPTVPQPMSAVEYIREYRRMCNFHFGKPAIDDGWDGCGCCPGRLNGKKNCIFSPTRDESSIPIVNAWAKEHPDEVNDE